MATRLYFERALTSDISPSSWSAGWNKTAGATTAVLRRAKIPTGVGNDTNAASGTSGHFTATSRFVSGPLKAQTIAGNIKGQMQATEPNATDDFTIAVAVKVIKPDGTDRGVLLAASASDDVSTSPPEMNTPTYTNRRFLNSSESATLALSSLGVSDGDRLVVEIGYRQASTSTALGGTRSGSQVGADLPEDDTDTDGTKSPWIEFDSDIVMWDIPSILGYNSVPADGAAATNTADPTAIFPGTDMVAGDLVVMVGHERATSAVLAISQASGQTWNSLSAIGTTTVTARVFWCIFNGTWGANPSVNFGTAVCNSVQIFTFRGSGSTYQWAIDVAQVELDIAAAATQTITGVTTLSPATLTLAGWFTADDNTWGSISGTGWSVLGDAQFRNTSGSDHSSTYAMKPQAAAGATGNVSKTQLTLGNDAATTFIVTFKQNEPAGPPPASVPNSMMMMGMGV